MMVSKYTDNALCHNLVLASGNQVLFVNMQLTLQGKSAGKGAKKTPEKGSKTMAAAPLHEVSPGSLLSDLLLFSFLFFFPFFGIIESVKTRLADMSYNSQQAKYNTVYLSGKK